MLQAMHSNGLGFGVSIKAYNRQINQTSFRIGDVKVQVHFRKKEH